MVANLFNRLLGFLTDETSPAAPPLEDQQSALDNLTDIFDSNVDLLAQGVADGTVTWGQFDGAMRAEIRQQQLGAAVVGSGGAHRATPQTYQLAQQQTDAQMQYFDAWSQQLYQQIQSGQTPSAAYIANRAKLYGKSAGSTFNQATTTALGVPELPFYPRDGSTKCLSNCCCEWRILPLQGAGNYDCFWIIDPECEHCPQCPARRAVCNPLRVRNGAIVDAERFEASNLYA